MLRRYLSTLALAGVVYALNGSITDYAPLLNQPCPDITTAPLLRVFTPINQSLHPGEQGYVNTRLTTVIPNEWKNWIGDGSAIGYNLSSFNSSTFPKIGIAISGGGYRAAQYGAGVLSALDARNESAKAAGTGGFLQVTSYLSGLSGASLVPVCS
jgi:lysophospholipase